MKVETFVRGPLQNNVYLLSDETSRTAALIDPALGSEDLLERITSAELTLVYILNTHGHFDHVENDAFFREATGASVVIHRADVPALHDYAGLAPDIVLEGGEALRVGALTLQVRHTPGHSPGSVCFLVGELLFAGDTLFAGSVGRYDLPGGDERALFASLKRDILSLPDETRVFPGHGQPTTVGAERATNPFLLNVG